MFFCKDWKLNCRKSWLGESSFGLSYFQNIKLSLLFDLKFLSFKEKDGSGLVHFIKIPLFLNATLTSLFGSVFQNKDWKLKLGEKMAREKFLQCKSLLLSKCHICLFLNSKVFVKIENWIVGKGRLGETSFGLQTPTFKTPHLSIFFIESF